MSCTCQLQQYVYILGLFASIRCLLVVRTLPSQSDHSCTMSCRPFIIHDQYTVVPLWFPSPQTFYATCTVFGVFNLCSTPIACCLGFSAFLRSGEFTCPSPSAYVSSMLSPRDKATDSLSTFLAVTLRSSKTDLFGAGHTLHIGATGNYLCPVAAILSYMAIRPPLSEPLFIHENGRPLSQMDLVQAVRVALQSTGLEVSRFNGHSFRIGAASTAANVPMPDSFIQTLGRWKSSAFLSYLRIPRDRLTAVSRQLLS